MANGVRDELVRAQDQWVQLGNPAVPIVAFWDEWIRDFMQYRAQKVRNFVAKWTKEMRLAWGTRTGHEATQVLEITTSLYGLSTDLEIFLDGLHQEPVD